MAKHNYVNNQDFLAAVLEHKQAVADAENAGEEKPGVTDYIGDCILKIATHLSHKPNFINYSYRDEMISDGVENCILYFHNFNPEKSRNPFAYFTQIIYYAFLRRIEKEHKQADIKDKLITEMPCELYDVDPGQGNGWFNYISENIKNNQDDFNR